MGVSRKAIINCPATKPNTICKYEKLLTATIPGTETNVTPEILEPIIAKATTYQVDLRFPTKKPWLSAFLPATYETVKSTIK